MQLRHHKAQKQSKPSAAKASPTTSTVTTDEPSAVDLPMQAEHLLQDAKNVSLFENVLTQINAFYDLAFNNGKEVLPIFVGVTAGGLMIELSAVRAPADASQAVAGEDLNVFTYQIGTELPQDIAPREIAEANMVKGQEQIRLQSSEYPMPDSTDGKAIAKWRFTQAETIQLGTMGVYEVQPENYHQITYGHGIEALGGTKESIMPLQDFKSELK